jgi:hypothetical protein
VPQRCGGLGQQVRVDLRGVHAELHHRTAGQQGRGVPVRGGDPVSQVRTVLSRGRDAAQRCGQLACAGRPVQVPGQRDDGPAVGHRSHRGEGVQQRRRGQVGGLVGGQGRAQPGLDPPGLRGLGEDE